MNTIQDLMEELESDDKLADSEVEWESSDELDSGMDDAIVIGDDNDMSYDSGNSTNYKTANKKAEKVPDEIVGDHWIPEEKALLLASIKQYGMVNWSHLASILETKNVRQIKDFIARVAKSIYAKQRSDAIKRARRRLAKLQVRNQRGRVSRNKLATAKNHKFKELFAQEMGEGPIEWWLHYMEKTVVEVSKNVKKEKDSQTCNPRAISELIPRAVQLIAQYEDHPHPSTCSGVDYKEAYECLYHVLSGMPPKALSPPTAMFIQRSIDRLRNSILEGMYSPDYCKIFGEQVSHIQTASKVTRLPPKRTYGAPSKKSGPVMTQGIGLPDPTQSVNGLMNSLSFNVMRVPETLTWRKGFIPNVEKEKPTVRQRLVVRKDIPFGLFCDTDIYEGTGPKIITK